MDVGLTRARTLAFGMAGRSANYLASVDFRILYAMFQILMKGILVHILLFRQGMGANQRYVWKISFQFGLRRNTSQEDGVNVSLSQQSCHKLFSPLYDPYIILYYIFHKHPRSFVLVLFTAFFEWRDVNWALEPFQLGYLTFQVLVFKSWSLTFSRAVIKSRSLFIVFFVIFNWSLFFMLWVPKYLYAQ